jgi:trans-2,3-dihydro-3-hydroxyanthranilate isomerase
VEDPVTGTASGVLGAHYQEFIKTGAPSSPLVVEQGQEVGRDGGRSVWVEKRGGEYHVRVGGSGCCVRKIEWPHD